MQLGAGPRTFKSAHDRLELVIFRVEPDGEHPGGLPPSMSDAVLSPTMAAWRAGQPSRSMAI